MTGTSHATDGLTERELYAIAFAGKCPYCGGPLEGWTLRRWRNMTGEPKLYCHYACWSVETDQRSALLKVRSRLPDGLDMVLTWDEDAS